MATNTPSAQLHDLLITHDFDVESKDAKNPNATPAPENADMFVFDFVANGNNYGTVVTLFDKDGTLNLFYGDNVGKSMEPDDKKEWYDFLYQLTMFAKRNCPSFEMQNISKLKYTLKGISAINEGLFEGYYGNKKVSYAGEPTEARLMIKHNRQLGENDKRYRYVESLFIETADEQRFKLPFTNLAGGRAMLEHVRQGGKPYDIRGCHIAEMVEDAKVLSRFNRARQNKIFEGETNELVEASTSYYENVRHTIKSLGNGRGYQKYFESWSPAQINETDTLVDSIKEMFIEQTLDSRIEQALPILAKIRQRETDMKEAQVFENWVNQICEGTWALPDSPEQQAKLQKLMSQPLLVGPDATNATEQLYDLVGDDRLFDILGDIADQDGGPDMNAWENPDVINRLGELGIDITPTTGAADDENTDQSDSIKTADAPEQGVAEGMDDSPVAAALTRKIMSQRLDLLKKYGPVKVTQAIDSAAEFFGDVEEIGSSDLNAYMQYVEKELGAMAEAIDPTNPRDYEIPAYQRKEKGMPPLNPGDIKDKDNASPTTSQGLDTLKNKLGIRENDDLARIKQLVQKI